MASRINALQVSPRGVSRWLALLLVLGLALGAISCRRGQLLNPNCAVNPETIDFGRVPLGGSADRPITISNSGSDSLAGTLTSLCSSYSVGNGRYSLAPGQSATLNLHFAANLVGEQDCAISTGLPGCQQIRAHAMVLATPPAPPCFASPTSLEFGSVPVGQTASRLITVRNPGASLLRLTSSSGCTDFALGGRGSSITLAPGQSTQVSVVFQPSFVGDESCALTISNGSGLNSGCGPILVHGSGTALSVRSQETTFPEISVGSSADELFFLTNGGDSLVAGQMSVSNPDFSVRNSDGTPIDGRFTVPGRRQVYFRLRWTPSVAGPATCTVEFGKPEYGSLIYYASALPASSAGWVRPPRR